MSLARLAISAFVLTCAWRGVAIADGDAKWDGTYATDAGGGSELCPEASASVVVSSGTFSIVWNIKAGDRLVRVGRLDGAVRETGFVVVKATLFDPLASTTRTALADMGDTPDELRTIGGEMKIVFTSDDTARTINLTSGNCYARWVAAGGEKKTTTATSSAKSTKSVVKAPPALAAGSPKWDSTYVLNTDSANDWRCPDADAFKQLIVKKGRFSFPWRIEANDERFGKVAIGQVDGSISASGAVKLRSWFTVTELPPELADGHNEATLAHVRTLVPTMKFAYTNGARQTKLSFGKLCAYELEDAESRARKNTYGTANNNRDGSKRVFDKTSGSSSNSVRRSGDGVSSSGTTSSSSKPPKGLANGAACTYGSDCASGECDYSKCVSSGSKQELGNGMACTYSSDCASGNCEYGKCASRGSKKDLSSGAECTYSSDCASGECTYGKCE